MSWWIAVPLALVTLVYVGRGTIAYRRRVGLAPPRRKRDREEELSKLLDPKCH